MRAFPLFVRLKRDFWGFFGAIWLLGGLLMLIIGVPIGIRGEGYFLAVVGVVLTAIGGRLVGSATRRLATEERLLREGLSAEAEVIAIDETNVKFNRHRQWVIRYRFTDRMGETHEGRSGYLDPEEAAAWNPGDRGVVRFDPRRPGVSMWIGKA